MNDSWPVLPKHRLNIPEPLYDVTEDTKYGKGVRGALNSFCTWSHLKEEVEGIGLCMHSVQSQVTEDIASGSRWGCIQFLGKKSLLYHLPFCHLISPVPSSATITVAPEFRGGLFICRSEKVDEAPISRIPETPYPTSVSTDPKLEPS